MTAKEAIENLEGCIVSEELENGKPNGNATCDLTREIVNMAIEALKRAEKKKVDDCEYGLPVYDENGCQIEAVFMYRAKCPECGYVILDGDFEKFDVGDYEINYCQRCGQALDWS